MSFFASSRISRRTCTSFWLTPVITSGVFPVSWRRSTSCTEGRLWINGEAVTADRSDDPEIARARSPRPNAERIVGDASGYQEKKGWFTTGATGGKASEVRGFVAQEDRGYKATAGCIKRRKRVNKTTDWKERKDGKLRGYVQGQCWGYGCLFKAWLLSGLRDSVAYDAL